MASKDQKGADSILGISDITDNKGIWQALVAEFIGTFLLVVVGCGSIVLGVEEGVDIVRIGLTFGIAVATIVQCISHVSGGHINPAVTLSMFVTGEIKLLRTLLYIAVQLVGAIGGSGVLRLMVPNSKEGNLGITDLSNDLTDIQGFLMEIILTFVLVFVIHSVCDTRRKDIKGSAPLAIGLAVTACHLCGIPYSGSSINPARSFGPAVIMDSWSHHWIYWAGPILGGVLAGLIYKFIFKAKKGDTGDSYDF